MNRSSIESFLASFENLNLRRFGKPELGNKAWQDSDIVSFYEFPFTTEPEGNHVAGCLQFWGILFGDNPLELSGLTFKLASLLTIPGVKEPILSDNHLGIEPPPGTAPEDFKLPSKPAGIDDITNMTFKFEERALQLQEEDEKKDGESKELQLSQCEKHFLKWFRALSIDQLTKITSYAALICCRMMVKNTTTVKNFLVTKFYWYVTKFFGIKTPSGTLPPISDCLGCIYNLINGTKFLGPPLLARALRHKKLSMAPGYVKTVADAILMQGILFHTMGVGNKLLLEFMLRSADPGMSRGHLISRVCEPQTTSSLTEVEKFLNAYEGDPPNSDKRLWLWARALNEEYISHLRPIDHQELMVHLYAVRTRDLDDAVWKSAALKNFPRKKIASAIQDQEDLDQYLKSMENKSEDPSDMGTSRLDPGENPSASVPDKELKGKQQ